MRRHEGVQIETAQVFIRKIETALTFRRDPNFLVIARSDAAEVEGEDEAIRRLNLAAEAGADMGFLFSSKGVFETLDSVKRACDQIKVPILYCLMEFCLRSVLLWKSCVRQGFGPSYGQMVF